MKSVKMKLIVILLNIILLSTIIHSQTSYFDPQLKHGKYTVGFKVVNQYDNSRQYNPENKAGDNPRPIQTLIWYPAVKEKNPKYMIYEDYVYLNANIEKFVPITDEEKQKVREAQISRRFPSINLNHELGIKTNSIKNAIPLKGSFPIIVYAPSWNSTPWENSELCEYLVSHGYIVVSSPSIGKNQYKMTDDMDGLGAQAEDIEFLVKYMKGYPNADNSKIGIAGYSWGGFANIITSQKLKNISAVLSLDGAISVFYNKYCTLTPYINPSKMNIPYMFISRKPETIEELKKRNRDTTFIFYNSLNKADAYLITLQTEHVDFNASSMKLQTNYTDMKENIPKEKLAAYRLICDYSLNFLNAYLKKGNKSKSWLKETPQQKGISDEFLKVDYKLK